MTPRPTYLLRHQLFSSLCGIMEGEMELEFKDVG